MPTPDDTNAPLAVLIDADNASAASVGALLTEVARYGVASVKRIYGDWTSPNLSPWKAVLLEHSIQPIQQFSYTKAKNATDSAMIIDAMDLLYTGTFAGFCLVSSDSDFTRLAVRIRESGRRVYGFGEKKTPRPFVAACDRFIYTEVLAGKIEEKAAPKPVPEKRSASKLRGDTRLVNLLRAAIEAGSDEAGLAHLGAVGNFIAKTANDFDSRTYGYAKLSELIDAIGLFKVERRNNGVYVRDGRVKKATNGGNGGAGNSDASVDGGGDVKVVA